MIRRHKRKVFFVLMMAVGVGLLFWLGWRGFVGALIGIVVCEIRDHTVA